MSLSEVRIELDDSLLNASRDVFVQLGTNTVDAVRAFLHYVAFNCNDPAALQPVASLLEGYGEGDPNAQRQRRRIAAQEGANIVYEYLDRYNIDRKVLENISYTELMEAAHRIRSDERRFQ